jgi:hypothetical protein
VVVKTKFGKNPREIKKIISQLFERPLIFLKKNVIINYKIKKDTKTKKLERLKGE